MVKTYLKTFPRMFKRHLTRLVSVILMVLVSIGFSAGIGMATDKMNYAIDDVHREKNLPDLVIKSTRDTGFTESELALLTETYGEENVQFSTSLELLGGRMTADTTVNYPVVGEVDVHMEVSSEDAPDGVSKVYFSDMPPSDVAIGKLEILNSVERGKNIPASARDIYVERPTKQLREYPLGSLITVTVNAVTKIGTQKTDYVFFVRGEIFNAMHMATQLDVSLQFKGEDGEQKELESIFYLFENGLAPVAANDAYITLPRSSTRLAMSPQYEKFVNAEKENAEALLTVGGASKAEVLTLFENFSVASYHEFANKIEAIGYVMAVVFLAVTLLVVLSTMTRLLEEERAQIACLMTLGYSPLKIMMKYLLFALAGTLIGTLGAYFAGLGLAYIVYINFTWNFMLPPFPARTSSLFFAVVSAVIFLATMGATLFAGLRMTRERPAELLRPKAPRAGKKVILERIPLLWNRLSFKYKSTLRNVLRYMVRFLMTVVAVMASTALVLAGLAVLDCCIFQDIGTSAMLVVGIVVVFFAALLNFVVIYTLTNINISERGRELATLMVLGYHDGEVAGYIFREIYITGAIGIALGIPFGAILCLFIFHLMVFGSLATVSWFVWILAPLLSLFFTFLVTLMLRPKIVKIDMNESLKAIE